MKTILIAISLHLLALLSSAQITFQKTFGGLGNERGYSVRHTNDGGYIIGGTRINITSDILLVKADTDGNLLWTKTYGGIDFDYGNSVQQTMDSGYIVAGSTNSFGSGNSLILLIKTDANGNSIWTKTFGGTSFDEATSVQQTMDGGYIITGATTSFSAANYDLYLIKTDINGNSIWTKIFGGPSYDYGYSVQQTSDSGYIIAGISSDAGGNYDLYLIKTDVNGDSLWTKTFGGTGAEYGHSVQQTVDGGYIVTGTTASYGAGGIDVYLIRIDAFGNLLWTKTFGGIGYDGGYSVQQTTDNGYIITGATSSDIFLIKTDTNGDTLWTKTYGGTGGEYGQSIQQTLDGGYIIAGFTSSFGVGVGDIYLIKTDSLGNSGCNEGSAAMTVTSPASQVSSPPTIVSSLSLNGVSVTPISGSGGIISTQCTTVNINESPVHNSILISPNPTVGNFSISFEGNIKKGHVKILNLLGENVYVGNILNESKKEINLNNISSGIYFVKVFDGANSYCKKLIVK